MGWRARPPHPSTRTASSCASRRSSASTPNSTAHYPPFFLGLAGLLALLPYALALWQGATLVFYVLAIRAILRPPSWPGLSPQVGFIRLAAHNSAEVGQARLPMPSTSSFSGTPQGVDARHKAGHDVEERSFADDTLWLLLALAYPAVFINLGHGHNGLLTAALIAGALTQLDRRPLIAGILIGLLAYKPQFGLLIPLVLAVSGRWRVFVAASVTVAALALAVTLAFGVDVWTAFLASTKFTRSVVLEQGGTSPTASPSKRSRSCAWKPTPSASSTARRFGARRPAPRARSSISRCAPSPTTSPSSRAPSGSHIATSRRSCRPRTTRSSNTPARAGWRRNNIVELPPAAVQTFCNSP